MDNVFCLDVLREKTGKNCAWLFTTQRKSDQASCDWRWLTLGCR